MKFKLLEDVVREENILNEQTYGLKDKPLSLDQLLNVAVGWRILDQLTNGNPLPAGFSLQSNLWGQGSADPGKVLHHIFGNWKYEEVEGITVQDHAKLHNQIRNILKFKLKKLSNIQDAYNTYVKAYAPTTNDEEFYNAIGNRLRAYENFFRHIAKSIKIEGLRLDVKDTYEKTFMTIR